MEKLRDLQKRIDALSLRERALVFFCSLFVLYLLWDSFFMQPLAEREKQLRTRMLEQQAEQLSLDTQIQVMVANRDADPDRSNREKLQALKVEFEKVENEVQAAAHQLIEPRQMAAMLEAVLRRVKGLSLLEVKGLGGQAIVRATPSVTGTDAAEEGEAVVEEAPASSVDNAYKHGLMIKFQGDYMSTLEYIRELENLQWDFFWDGLEFNVNQYPDSTASITVFTLSLDKNWIGV